MSGTSARIASFFGYLSLTLAGAASSALPLTACSDGPPESAPATSTTAGTASGGGTAGTASGGATAGAGASGGTSAGGTSAGASSGGAAAGETTTAGNSVGGAAGSAGAAAGAGGAAGTSGAPSGIIYFSNDGLLTGWDHAKPQSNTIGQVVEVTEPVYKSTTSILTEQTYVKPQGAHSEVVMDTIQKNDEDRFYGQAIYLPLDWNSIDKNATFQQFSPENPAGPWNLNWIQNDHIFIRVAGTHYDCGPIQKGVWTRVVVRFKTFNPGIFEYWVDGDKKWSITDKDLTIPNGSPSMRWSVGIYVTWWRDQEPGPQLTRQIFHDQLRVTSSYETADPANWQP